MLPILAEVNRFLYAPLLLASVSLVYAGTRHEELNAILRHAANFGVWTVVFMAVIAAVIEVLAFFQ